MHRLPKVLHSDNGSEFHSQALSRGCERYGINLEYRPPGRPLGSGGRLPAQRLLDRSRPILLVVEEPLHYLGMLKYRDHQAAERQPNRVDTRWEKQAQEAVDLIVGQALSF